MGSHCCRFPPPAARDQSRPGVPVTQILPPRGRGTNPNLPCGARSGAGVQPQVGVGVALAV
eukprot:scaffold1184_cov188-Prasinococcus_capsulatus_cf.AAC.1